MAGVALAVGCGGKAVHSGGSSTSGGNGSGNGGSVTTTTAGPSPGTTGTPGSGGTATGGTTSTPPDDPPPPDGPVDVPPPTMPPVMGPPNNPPSDPPDDPAVDPSLPSECEVGYRETGRGWCEVELECDGRYSYTWCDSEGDEAYCFCEGDRYYGDFILSGVAVGESCEVVAPYCARGEQPELGELVCEPHYPDAGSQYCSSEAECTRTAELADGVTLQVRDWRYVWCEANGSDWTCDCNSNFDYVRFDFEEAGGDICPQALGLCIEGDLEASGPLSCEPRYQSASQTYCDSELDCIQEGMLGGTPVSVHSSVWMSCQQSSAGEYRCDCQLPSGTVSFSLEGSDIWGACQGASQLCAEAASG